MFSSNASIGVSLRVPGTLLLHSSTAALVPTHTSSVRDDRGMVTPQLEGDALAAVCHRGTHLQILASAGSGKTEVVSQRVADLLAGGESPRSIVAFTFTERAAEELKNRIRRRVEERLGPEARDLLGGLF